MCRESNWHSLKLAIFGMKNININQIKSNWTSCYRVLIAQRRAQWNQPMLLTISQLRDRKENVKSIKKEEKDEALPSAITNAAPWGRAPQEKETQHLGVVRSLSLSLWRFFTIRVDREKHGTGWWQLKRSWRDALGRAWSWAQEKLGQQPLARLFLFLLLLLWQHEA